MGIDIKNGGFNTRKANRSLFPVGGSEGFPKLFIGHNALDSPQINLRLTCS